MTNFASASHFWQGSASSASASPLGQGGATSASASPLGHGGAGGGSVGGTRRKPDGDHTIVTKSRETVLRSRASKAYNVKHESHLTQSDTWGKIRIGYLEDARQVRLNVKNRRDKST